MKKFLTLIAIVSVSAGSAFAGCGKIDTTEGKLKSFNPETKIAVVETKDKKKVNVTLTPTSKGGDSSPRAPMPAGCSRACSRRPPRWAA